MYGVSGGRNHDAESLHNMFGLGRDKGGAGHVEYSRFGDILQKITGGEGKGLRDRIAQLQF